MNKIDDKKGLWSYPLDKLKTAKKAVILQVEVDGQSYQEVHDATGGLFIGLNINDQIKIIGIAPQSLQADLCAFILNELYRENRFLAMQIIVEATMPKQ